VFVLRVEQWYGFGPQQVRPLAAQLLMPQVPQWGSVVTSTHWPPQHVSELPQRSPQPAQFWLVPRTAQPSGHGTAGGRQLHSQVTGSW
jgi:hypothetical protein